MKKLLVLALVLSMATMASATLTIVGAPAELNVGDTFALSITSDGATVADQDVVMTISGPGSLDLSAAYNYQAPGGIDDGLGWVDGDPASGMVWLTYGKPASGDPPVTPFIMSGTVTDGIVFTCTDIGDVTLSLFANGGSAEVYSTVVITQVPEPMTMGLLGLGGLFLRRRK